MTNVSTSLDRAAISARSGCASACALAALALGVILTWGRTVDVWTTGAYFDTDDAMRMVQVRNLLGGQGWYDMSEMRMDPPAGVFMHWSRTIDIPLVLLMKFFGLFADQATAEALTRIAFPLLLLAALYAAVGWLAAQFGDRTVRITAVALAFLSGATFAQFVPGRIDHHAPQIVLLALMTAAAIAALDPKRSELAAIAGLCIATSLSISVENLPFILVLCAAQPLGWIVYGEARRRALAYFALGLGVSLIAWFLATIGPQRWFVVACDAYSIAHAVPGVVGAGALATLALLSQRLATVRRRLVAALVAALLPIVALKVAAPACLGDPFVGLDPVVRTNWLDHVSEVQKLLDFATTKPYTALTIGLPLIASLIATALAAFFARGLHRERLLHLLALIAVGVAGTFWGIRVSSSTAPLAAVGAAVAAVAYARFLTADAGRQVGLIALLCLPFASFAYAIALPDDHGGTTSAERLSCLRPEAVKPLGALPRGVILAPIDTGPYVLVFTDHSTIAAPYHRDNHGNRLAIEAFGADAARAEQIVRGSGANYLVICPAQIKDDADPRSLASAIRTGAVPDWLTRIDDIAGPNMAFRIKPTK